MKMIRCAIYTRKSSEEGLEQDFNSLDAQREACAAYILSQASEGWTALPDHYDDGGISGGTLERPALKRLLADVAAKRVDIIVVYKVDRLSRSLFDFAKLVEQFEASGTSFVSVTQSFNTTTSMGRLTLNMLLSFAQFEREVTAERIRDKLAASKAKGMWMGGVPPLGYRPDGRTLEVVEEHAAIVRHIFARYRELRSVRLLGDELEHSDIRSPTRTRVNGSTSGGSLFSRGQLYAILTRRLYLGEITHKGASYPGLHPAIIDRDLFDAVQTIIADNRQGEHPTRSPRPHLLAGKVFDEAGEPLIGTHSTKGKVRYRYYTSQSLSQARTTAGMRIPSRDLETLVIERLAQALDDPLTLLADAQIMIAPHLLLGVIDQARSAAASLRKRDSMLVRELVSQVTVHATHIDMVCSVAALSTALGLPMTEDDGRTLTLTSHAQLKRSGHAVRLVQPSGDLIAAEQNRSLLRLLARARRWWGELRSGQIDATRLAAREGVTRSYLLRVTRLAFLSPAITEQILHGRQSAGFTPAALTAPDAVVADWKLQAGSILAAGQTAG